MPITNADFTVSQDAGDKSILTITEDITGSDGSLTARRVYLKLHTGNYLVKKTTTTQYEAWAINSQFIDIPVVNKDYALEITVQWIGGSSVIYTKTRLYIFIDYAEQFRYELTQHQAGNPRLLNNQNFYSNKMKLKVLIDSAVQAVEQFGDQVSAQYALDAAKQLMDNPIYFY